MDDTLFITPEHTKKEKTEICECRAVPDYVLYCTHTVHEQATVTAAAAAAERESESIVVLLSDVWFPLDNTLFITPVIQY